MSFKVRPVAGTTRRGYDLANFLEERVRDGSPEFWVRLVAGTSLQGYDSSNCPTDKGVTAFVFRFTNDILEKFLLANSRHARSGEMRRGYTTAIRNLGKSDYQLMQPRTPTFFAKFDSKHVKPPLPG